MWGHTVIVGLSLVLAGAACAQSVQEVLAEAQPVSESVCQPDAGSFTIDIDNPFLPFPVGALTVLEGRNGGRDARVEITVLDDTETIAGVETRVVEEKESIEGEIVEISRTFVVQASDGTVCHYGEEAGGYRDGDLIGHRGAWKAGENCAQPGILMPADLIAGTSHQQENAPGMCVGQSDFDTVSQAAALLVWLTQG